MSLSDKLGTNRLHHCRANDLAVPFFELSAKEGCLSLRKRVNLPSAKPSERRSSETEAQCTAQRVTFPRSRPLSVLIPGDTSFQERRATKLYLQIDIENQDHAASASWTEPRAPVISLACHRVI